MKKKYTTQFEIRDLLGDLILGPKYLSKSRKIKIKKILKLIDGISIGGTGFYITVVEKDGTILDFPVTVGIPHIENPDDEE